MNQEKTVNGRMAAREEFSRVLDCEEMGIVNTANEPAQSNP
jgi:hypothetical protein